VTVFFLFSLFALILGFVFDLIIGDPQSWPHIARIMGKLIVQQEKALYPLKNKRFAGLLLIMILCAICVIFPAVLLYGAWRVSRWLYFVIETLLIWQCLATKDLYIESNKVYKELKKDDLSAAKNAVSMIVGRDTENLDDSGITRACVETVAENTADGVVAPLFYIALFGAAGGCLYKAVNTADSMLGYKNEKYIDFGRAAAKFDDFFNFIPSRLTALLMIAAAWIGRLDVKSAYCIWRRDRRKHASPNSAQAESAAAGALGIRLAGDAVYKGILIKKPYIGDDTRKIEAEDIRRSHKLLFITAFLMFILALAFRGIVLWRYVYAAI